MTKGEFAKYYFDEVQQMGLSREGSWHQNKVISASRATAQPDVACFFRLSLLLETARHKM